MAAPVFLGSQHPATRLADPTLREGLLKFARRRLPPAEVEDLVQNTLADALGSTSAPSDDADFRRWVQGIARHKIADIYRRHGRLPPFDSDSDAISSDPGPATGELTQWIERELPKTEGAEATLHWLLREGDGESLDEIAREAALPPPRVRQRVSRLRRHFQTRWLALGAAGIALLLGAGLIFHAWRAHTPPSIAREVALPPSAQSAPAPAVSPIPQPSAGPTSPTPKSKATSPNKIEPTFMHPTTRLPSKKPKAPAKRVEVGKQQALPNQAVSPLGDEPLQKSGDRKTLAPTKD